MAKTGGSVVHFLAWFTGIVVSIVVGYAMITQVLVLPWWLGGMSAPWLSVGVGWIVVITTLLSAILAILKK